MNSKRPFQSWIITILIITIICWSKYSIANPIGDQGLNLSLADTQLGVIDQLRSINGQLRVLRLQINTRVPYKEDELIQLLQEAKLGRQLGQSLEASFTISKVLNHHKISRLTAYPQLLETLSKSLIDIGLPQAGYQRLKEYLSTSKSTPSQYESILFAYLNTAQRLANSNRLEYTATEIKKYWLHYRRLCQKFNRIPSIQARYMLAKHLYFLKSYDEAEQQLKIVTQRKGYVFRALYIMGVMSLDRGSFGAAKKYFKEIEDRLKLPKKIFSDEYTEITSSQKNLRIRVLKEKPSTQSAIKQDNTRSQELSPDLQALLDEVMNENASLFNLSVVDSLSSAPPLEVNDILEVMQSLLHMTLARIALLEGEYVEAWQRYRAIPISNLNTLHRESVLEAAYVLRMRGEYAWCARVLKSLLKDSPSSESTLQLQLAWAEMLVKAQSTSPNSSSTSVSENTGYELYKELEENLQKQKIQVESAKDSKVLFPPEIQAWLPQELSSQGRQFSESLREQEIWLEQAKIDLSMIKEASKTGQYPALIEATNELQSFEKTVHKRLRDLPQLINKWREQKSTSVLTEVKLGRFTSPDPSINRYSPAAIQASMQQLLARIKKAQVEVVQLNKFYQKNLVRLIKTEEQNLKRASKKFSKLKQQIYNLSQKAQILALQRVEGYLAQMTLGPTLSHFWSKEQASENLLYAQKDRVSEIRQLQYLNKDEETSPKIRSLDLVDPVFKSFIVDPLPDLEKDLPNVRKRSRFRRRISPLNRRRQF